MVIDMYAIRKWITMSVRSRKKEGDNDNEQEAVDVEGG